MLYLVLLFTILELGKANLQECPTSEDSSCEAPPPEPICGVYMAPSTLGDHTNMGIFTGFNLKESDVINFPEIAIPLLFRNWGFDHDRNDDGSIWDRYIWEGFNNEIETYVDTDRIASKAVFVPGVGCTVNSNLDMNNILSTHGSIYDTAGLDRSKDPGVGAYSPYHRAKTVATVDILAGSELFASYGHYWIPSVPGAIVTFDQTLDQGDAFFAEFFHWTQEQGLNEEVKNGLWNLTVNDFPYYSQTFTTLPKVSWSELDQLVHSDNSLTSVTRHYVRKAGMRSLEWLQENGKCQDHIKPGRSTIKQAGHGAFANRFLPKGTVVGYAPLIHIGKNGRNMFNVTYPDGRSQMDLIINYSFGHRDSTVMLTPYGGMVNYINHSRERANVKVVWPDKELVAHKPEWLEKDVHFLSNLHHKIGLSFDYVALRDIQEGEEIFMDYGSEWVEAWEEHVANFEPYNTTFRHSSEFQIQQFRTVEELEVNPYPDNLHTMCYHSYRATSQGYFFLPVLRRNNYRVYCKVLRRHEGGTYDVEMLLDNNETVVVQYVQENAIFLYDKAYSGDWHLPNAFRHEIMIPDDIFPDTWKNKL